MNYPPGFVGIISGSLTRYPGFLQSALHLQLPPGTPPPEVMPGHWVAVAINILLRNMPETAQWFLLLADDHRFRSDLVLRLLERNVDVVAPLCPLRRWPYGFSMFRATQRGYLPYPRKQLKDKRGLFPVDTLGGAGVLLTRRVLDAIGDPWFEWKPGERQTPKEDLYFFDKVRQAGFQPYIDLDQWITHYYAGEVAPTRDADGNYRVVAIHDEHVLGLLPMPTEEERFDNDYHAYA